jgi:hypothetical protein
MHSKTHAGAVGDASAGKAHAAHVEGELEGLRQPAVSWTELQRLQLDHDVAFHKDVHAATPAYAIRHSIMHLQKVVASLATVAEKRFHGESINEAELDLTERRLPDLQAFVLKLANLLDLELQVLFKQLGPSLQGAEAVASGQMADVSNATEWLEAELAKLEQAVAEIASCRLQLMKGEPNDWTRKTIRDALIPAEKVALQLAAFYERDLEASYRERLLAVEHRKLA